jgi:site-specific recombinase XerD
MAKQTRTLARFERDLRAAGSPPNTIDAYQRAAKKFIEWLGGRDRAPSRARESDLRDTLLELEREGYAARSRNVAIAALQRLYTETLRRPTVVLRLRRVRVAEQPAVILSGSEVQRLIEAARKPGAVLTRNAVKRALDRIQRDAGLSKHVTPHTLRHTYATHLLDAGADLRTVQVLLGHKSITSTQHYTRLSRVQLAQAPSPAEMLGTRAGRVLG